MWREIRPDERFEIDVDGYRVVAYSFGTGSETVFCLNGGPGLPCDYLREAHSCLTNKGYRVVAFDQLGTGASDRPDDLSLWTIGRYVEETETVRKALGLGKIHMLGHSWGGWLAIDYALTYPENLKTLILEDTVADMADRIDRQHQSPLHPGAAGEEFVDVTRQGRHRRQDQEGIDRDEDRKEAVPLRSEQHVMQRQDDEEGQEKRQMIAAPRWCQGPEFAKRHKG